MTAKIVSIKKNRIDYDWGLDLVLKKRKALLHSVPIMSDQLTEIDKWLSTQPGLPIKVYCDIWTRAMMIDYLLFDDLTPAQKRFSLIRLRDHFEDFCRLPPRIQKKLWPMWERWHAQFIEEEEQEAANA
ncbi:MAG: hypothetical protein WAV38_25350 [Xanthobacteraceae bacterium]